MIKNQPTFYLKRRRKMLAQRLVCLGPYVIRGAIYETYIPCGNPRCKCQGTRGHGPKHYLNTSYPGGQKSENDYIPQAYTKTVKGYLSNLKTAREIMEDICMINLEILRRRDKL